MDEDNKPSEENVFTAYPYGENTDESGQSSRQSDDISPENYTPYTEEPVVTKKEKEPKKRDPMRRKFLAFGAVTVAVCLFISFFSGALASFVVMTLYPVMTAGSAEEETTENLFVPAVTESSTTVPAAQETVTADGMTDTTVTPAVNETTTQPNEVTAKTKGEIYADCVNQVVCVTATYHQKYSGWFGQSYSQEVTSSGSGFFITADGYIITNYHVIESAESVKISTYDGTEYNAVITGYEAANDVAVLKAEGNFTPVTLGESSSLAVGDDVMIIGNALGELSYTFTDGVISYLSRAISTDAGTTINMFQTNAAINEGNSGGPVYNMEGEVVGIASAKYASESIEGLGFCIPIDDVKSPVSDIIQFGYVTGKAEMGVSLQAVSTTMSYRYNLPVGCYVVAVGDLSAAAIAGITENDVIVALDGNEITDCDDVSSVLSSKKAGDSLTVKLYRSGSYKQLTLILDEYEPADARTSYSNVYDY